MDGISLLVEVRLLEGGSTRALADVTFRLLSGEELTVLGFRVVRKEGEAAWVAFPTSGYPKDGKFVTKPVLEMRRSLKKQVVEAVLAEFEKKVAERA